MPARSPLTYAILSLLHPLLVLCQYGQWSPLITFPLVPVAATVDPVSGKLLVWSAYADDYYAIGYSGVTQTAVYDPTDGSVTAHTVSNLDHDMFCPGIATDANGNVFVTGGDTAAKASVYNASQQAWLPAPDLTVARGYTSSTTLSDGQRIFLIGGSWSGGGGSKDGEVWDGQSWTLLRGCPANAILTNDPEGIYRQDNHAMLHAWQNGSVFHAGPSKNMNWFYPEGVGNYASAGARGNDGDAMCGTSTMYDATAGKILNLGGSPAYQNALATTNANLIQIGSPGSQASVQSISGLFFPRIFHTSTVLPDGKVITFGGQSYGLPFSDANSSQWPELWDPATGKFSLMSYQNTPRNYHSVSVLLPDARVFSGGGGLCGNCTTNHFNGEIFSPPYLYQSDGSTLATRPTIQSVGSSTAKVGGAIEATIDSGSGTITWSMVRMGTSTHTVNGDQRRVPLTSFTASGSTYSLTLPPDPGMLLPGFWYLFAMRNGVPSVAKIIKVTP